MVDLAIAVMVPGWFRGVHVSIFFLGMIVVVFRRAVFVFYFGMFVVVVFLMVLLVTLLCVALVFDLDLFFVVRISPTRLQIQFGDAK